MWRLRLQRELEAVAADQLDGLAVQTRLVAGAKLDGRQAGIDLAAGGGGRKGRTAQHFARPRGHDLAVGGQMFHRNRIIAGERLRKVRPRKWMTLMPGALPPVAATSAMAVTFIACVFSS